MDGDEVGLCQKLVHLNVRNAELLFDAGDVEDIERNHVHANGLCHHAQMLADAAEADDAERLALELDALAVGFLFPLVLAHGMAGDGDIAGAGEHMGHGELRDRLRGGSRSVLNGDAVFLSVLHIDVVYANAAADDELELTALGFVDVVCAHLGLGADDDRIEFAKGSAQLIRLIKLLNDFVTCFAQLRHSGLVHSIGNENSHDMISLFLM